MSDLHAAILAMPYPDRFRDLPAADRLFSERAFDEGRHAAAELVSAALSAPAVPQWMPIEAAPKDGTEVLLSNGTDVSAGNWLHREGGIHERRDLEGRYIDQDEDEGYDGWIDWSGGMNPKPSHWMPLPESPK